jgi:hypothetical protein
MEGVSCDGQGGHGLVTDGQSGGIVAGVQFGVHAEPGAGAGGGGPMLSTMTSWLVIHEGAGPVKGVVVVFLGFPVVFGQARVRCQGQGWP